MVAGVVITMVAMAVMVAVGRVAGYHLRWGRLQEWLLLSPITGLHLFITRRNIFIHHNRKLQLTALRTDFTIHKHKPAQVAGNESFIKR
jgi:hypothetical protein